MKKQKEENPIKALAEELFGEIFSKNRISIKDVR